MWAWYNPKTKQKFLSKTNLKGMYAQELMIFGDIKLSKTDCKWADIKDQSSREIWRLDEKTCIELMKRKGWIWKSGFKDDY